jgi:uncharacterized damage-inducible protein DinB
MDEQGIYPTGRFKMPAFYNDAEYILAAEKIAQLPVLLSDVRKQITTADLTKTYREGGWNIRQIIHHIADSHLNAYIRLKLALTEDNPTIKPYDENKWAALPDSADNDIDTSLQLITLIHKKITLTLNHTSAEQLARTYFHPQSQQKFALFQMAALYAWHGAHHVGQIKVALAG